MLPCSHSGSGRCTCRSTARITALVSLADQLLSLEDGDRVANLDRTTLDHGGHHAAPALQLKPKPLTNLIHPKAGFAHLVHLEHRPLPHPQSGSQVELHYRQAFDGEVLFDGAGLEAEPIQVLLVRQQHLPLRGCARMLVSLQSNSFEEDGRIYKAHRLAMSGTELNGGDPGSHDHTAYGTRRNALLRWPRWQPSACAPSGIPWAKSRSRRTHTTAPAPKEPARTFPSAT